MSQDVCSEIQPENTSQSPQEHLAKWLWELLETQFVTDVVHLSVRTSFDAKNNNLHLDSVLKCRFCSCALNLSVKFVR